MCSTRAGEAPDASKSAFRSSEGDPIFLGAKVGVEVAGAVCGPSGQGGGHSGLLEAPGTRWRSLIGLARSEEGGVDVGRFLGSFRARCLWWFVEAVGGLGLKRGLGREGGGLVSWVVRSGRLLMTVVLERQGGRLLCEVKRRSLFGGGFRSFSGWFLDVEDAQGSWSTLGCLVSKELFFFWVGIWVLFSPFLCIFCRSR